jgi:hypothetical protein
VSRNTRQPEGGCCRIRDICHNHVADSATFLGSATTNVASGAPSRGSASGWAEGLGGIFRGNAAAFGNCRRPPREIRRHLSPGARLFVGRNAARPKIVPGW